ncbi:MAG: translational GTPase TypA [Planctomycetes bacterium]|nr:translational GTPase TypA [Planctomycetota bacterium]NOG55435.1 translational GTPase TypA [Planctomycetota bacterium]
MLHAADPNLRNVAIIAHVDHGKTTLVDAMLECCGSLSLKEEHTDCILDSDPIEKERGITIFSKNCAITYRPTDGDHVGTTHRINLIDTPGHADFGGEVERVLKMADGVLLLVDAFEGPMPQTRFVLSKALELDHPLIVVINKCDRPNARTDEVVNEVFDLLVSLDAGDAHLDFPIIYASGRDGWASVDAETVGDSMVPLLDTIIEKLPAPLGYADAPLQMLITTADYSSYVGRIAIGRVFAGAISSGQAVTLCHADGTQRRARAQKVFRFQDLGRVPADIISVGDLCAVEGIGDFEIGDTIACPDEPFPIARVAVDEPTLHMLFRINDSPFAGKEGKYVTSRQLSDRLDRELKSNLALRVEPGDTTEEFRVSGRGMLHLGILLENMRREGYELSVGRPQVIEKTIDGLRCEPIELLTIDVGADHMGAVLELIGSRGAEVQSLDQRGDQMHIECEIPAISLIGLRSIMLTATAGNAVMYHAFQRYAPVRTKQISRQSGVMIATEQGQTKAYALQNLADRGVMFVKAQDPVYPGQIVGEHNRANDLPVNVVKGKAFSNVRESTKEATVTLKAPRLFTLEAALEYIESDEFVEITPHSIRLRKEYLSEAQRKKIQRSRKSDSQ